MAWIEQRKREDGGTSAHVVWRLGGGRNGPRQTETFAVGTDEQNMSRAEGFKKMVEAAGGHWPQDWVKGEGFVRPKTVDAYTPPPRFAEVGAEYVRQIVDLSPGQRKRYLGQVTTLAETRIRQQATFERPVNAITELDIKAWLIDWDRALKTKANYHGLLYGIFTYAVEQGYATDNPCARTAPKRSRVRQAQAELRFLTEDEWATVAAMAGRALDMMTVAIGTGLRFGEISALWVSDVDLVHHTIRVNKAWKRDGEDGRTETPAWLKKAIKPQHKIRQHHLGSPKTVRSRRTVTIAPALAETLARLIRYKAADDFVFTTGSGGAWHHSDFYVRVWKPLMERSAAAGVAPFRFHDLRHTHVSWLIAGGASLPHIQARLGHESITTTIDTYGHLLPAGDELINEIIQTAVTGGRIKPVLRLVGGSSA
jgi:integrase